MGRTSAKPQLLALLISTVMGSFLAPCSLTSSPLPLLFSANIPIVARKLQRRVALARRTRLDPKSRALPAIVFTSSGTGAPRPEAAESLSGDAERSGIGRKMGITLQPEDAIYFRTEG